LVILLIVRASLGSSSFLHSFTLPSSSSSFHPPTLADLIPFAHTSTRSLRAPRPCACDRSRLGSSSSCCSGHATRAVHCQGVFVFSCVLCILVPPFFFPSFPVAHSRSSRLRLAMQAPANRHSTCQRVQVARRVRCAVPVCTPFSHLFAPSPPSVSFSFLSLHLHPSALLSNSSQK
jgi:hypothetical protein